MKLLADALWHIRADENIVEGRIVPFGEPAIVMEEDEMYQEGFDPGSLTRMCQIAKQRGNAAWIGFTLDHDESFANKIGYARSIEQRDDGAWAEFKLYPSTDLLKVRAMLEESYQGLSVEFTDVAPPREEDGVRWRTQVSVRNVAATPLPTYTGATITSVRQADPLLVTPKLNEWLEYVETL